MNQFCGKFEIRSKFSYYNCTLPSHLCTLAHTCRGKNKKVIKYGHDIHSNLPNGNIHTWTQIMYSQVPNSDAGTGRGEGPGGHYPPIFGSSVNPISTIGGRFCPPFTSGTPMFFTFRHHCLICKQVYKYYVVFESMVLLDF